MKHRRLRIVLARVLVAAGLLLSVPLGCAPQDPDGERRAADWFVDATEEAGLTFGHHFGLPGGEVERLEARWPDCRGRGIAPRRRRKSVW